MTIHIDQGNGIDIAARIDPEWSVLDIGGGMNPLARADWVVDILPYESRREFAGERFNKSRWIEMDFGGSKPYKLPFSDKIFDFVWCQQTLEDIADPFMLVREIQRVGKAGFIEIPSREWEHTVGVDSEQFCGFCHHRWYGELILDDEDYRFELIMKSPYVMQYGALSGPRSVDQLGFIWMDSFQITERSLLTKEKIIEDVIYFKNIGRLKQIGAYA